MGDRGLVRSRQVAVAHYPAACSKGNPIEHRLFSQISRNWRGRPVEPSELVLNCLKTTMTRTGLTVPPAQIQRGYRRH